MYLDSELIFCSKTALAYQLL